MICYALVSRACRENVEIYLSRDEAEADATAAVKDEPAWEGVLAVLPVDLGATAESSSFSVN